MKLSDTHKRLKKGKEGEKAVPDRIKLQQLHLKQRYRIIKKEFFSVRDNERHKWFRWL